MKKKILFSALLLSFVGTPSFAATSTINPAVPAQGSSLSSAVLRQNFQAAYNDITNIYSLIGNALSLGANQLSGSLSGGTPLGLSVPSCSGASNALTWTLGSGFGCNNITVGGSAGGDLSGTYPNPTLANTSQARSDLGLGSAAVVNTGTSGGTLGLLNAGNTFSGANIFSGINSFTALTKHSLNVTSLPASQTGTLIQIANADTVPSRIENDSFGASSYFSGVRYDGTNASPTTLQASDEISGMNAFGFNGSAVVGPKASFRLFANQNWTTGANGTYADIATTPNGSTTLTQVARFENDGGITVPSTVTGGDKGTGTINAAGLYVNGVAVSTSSGGVTSVAGDGIVLNTTPLTGAAALTTATQTANTVLGAPSTTLSRLSMPSCSGATNALTWTSGTGFGCNTLSGSSVSVTAASSNIVISPTPGTGTFTVDLAAAPSATTSLTAPFVNASTASTGFELGGVNAINYPSTDTTAGGTIAIGSGALVHEGSVTSAALGNTAIGYQAIGSSALTNAAIGNTAVGFKAITALTGNPSGGYYNTAVGWSALSTLTTANSNTAVGYGSLALATGSGNTAIGSASGNALSSGTNNTFIGSLTGVSITQTGSNIVLLGASATTAAFNSTNLIGIGASTTTASNELNIGGAVIETLTTPTISSGFGASPSIVKFAGSHAFTVNVGTGGSATSGVIAFPVAAPNGWACDVTDSTTTSTTVFMTKSAPTSTTSVTLTNYSTAGTAAAWAASDVLVVKCAGY